MASMGSQSCGGKETGERGGTGMVRTDLEGDIPIFNRCRGGPYDGKMLMAGDDRGVVSFAGGRYLLIGNYWNWQETA